MRNTILITCFYLSTLSLQTLAAESISESIKEIRVFKSERKLQLITEQNTVFKTYKIMLGRNPEGKKTKDGDNKTPEGTYTLDLKNDKSKFHKAFHISYPNFKDILRARLQGKNPGRDIMLHGLPNELSQMEEWLEDNKLDRLPEENVRANLVNYDWTNGCIAVTDTEIDEIYSIVDVPTKIIINP